MSTGQARARAAVALLACLTGMSSGCTSKERTDALAKLSSRAPHERAEAARRLGRVAGASDDEAWAALQKAAHDPAGVVRRAVAGAMGAAPRGRVEDATAPLALVDDTLGLLLLDPDSAVADAAAEALGVRCTERAVAVMRASFAKLRRGRDGVAAALGRCGVALEQALGHDEQARRAHAQGRLKSMSGAQQAAALRELGLLGRAEDIARVAPFLSSRDGAVAAGAATALGEAGATAYATQLAALLGEQETVARAAAQALRLLGPEAVRANLPRLRAVAAGAEGQAVEASRALVAAAPQEERCAAAAETKNDVAAALLSAGCPAGPLAEALGSALDAAAKPGDAAGEAPPGVAPRLEAFLHADGQAAGTATLEPRLVRLIPVASRAFALRLARVAQQSGAAGAGPALVARLRREVEVLRKARAEVAAHPPESVADADAPSAQTDPARLARLNALLSRRQQSALARGDAQVTLAGLLREEAANGDPTLTVAGLLRAAVALGAKGASEQAAALAADPSPAIAEAARPSPQAPEGQPDPRSAPPAIDLGAAREALWGSDGEGRAAACTALARARDAASAPLRAALSKDPERRVRLACAAGNETDAPAPR